jgi:hypothetical protein
MTHIDPRDPRRADIDPLPPARDPRFDRASGNNWGLIGGLAAVLVLVIVMMSMFGTFSDQTARSPEAQRPPIAQGTPGPATDPATTGTVPRQQPAPVQPTPTPTQPAPAPQTTPPNQQP